MHKGGRKASEPGLGMEEGEVVVAVKIGLMFTARRRGTGGALARRR